MGLIMGALRAPEAAKAGFYMGKEKTDRKRPRKAVRRAYVEYSRSGTRLSRLFQPEIKRGPMVNISKDGVQFRTTEALDADETLYMTLRFPDIREPIKLKVRVCWIREEKKIGIENYTHVIGAQFLEFTPHGWDLIAAATREP